MSEQMAYVLGETNAFDVTVVSQPHGFERNAYLHVLDESNGLVIGEVQSVWAVKSLNQENLPTGATQDEVSHLGIDQTKPCYLAQVKLLQPLAVPLTPGSIVKQAPFEAIEPYLSATSPKNSLVLGVVRGTGHLQDSLPTELKAVAPLWRQGMATQQIGIPFLFNHHAMREYPGIGIFGGSGSGKSSALRALCEELMKHRIPGIILDPHNEFSFKGRTKGLEAHLSSDFENAHRVFYIGRDVGIRFEELRSEELVTLFNFLNLSEVGASAVKAIHETGETLSTFKKRLRLLKDALEQERKPKHERQDLSAEQERLVAKLGAKVAGFETLQAIMWRFEQLESTKIFTSHTESVEKALKERQLAVIRGDGFRMSLLAAHLLNKVYQKRRAYMDWNETLGYERPEFFPPHILILDEAHRFAPKEGNHPTKTLLRVISQEARKYGVFEIVSTQRADNLDPTLVSQMNTKLIFRTNNAMDIATIQRETNLTESELASLPDLNAGACYFSSAVLSKTFPVQFRTAFTQAPNILDPFDELPPLQAVSQLEDILEQFLPTEVSKLAMIHPQVAKALGKTPSVEEMVAALNRLVERDKAIAIKNMFGTRYEKNLRP